MSADAATTEPVAAPAPSTEPHTEPQGGAVVATKVDKFFLSVFFTGTVVMVFILITTTTGQWAKRADEDSDYQVNLWGKCLCDQTNNVDCDDLKRLFKAAQGFSGIAVICEFLALFVFGLVHGNLVSHKGVKVVGVLLAWLGAVSLLLTIAMFGSNFNQDYCGHKLKEVGDLHWSYGVRIVEFVIWVGVAIMFSVQTGKDDAVLDFKRAILLIGFTVFCLTIVTTAGRGWIRNDIPGDFSIEFGLWEACTCEYASEFHCASETRTFRSMEAFALLSLVFQYLLIVTMLFAVPKAVLCTFAWFVFASIGITWGLFAGWWNKTSCDFPPASENTVLAWPFGLNIVAFVVQIVVAIMTSVGAAGKF